MGFCPGRRPKALFFAKNSQKNKKEREKNCVYPLDRTCRECYNNRAGQGKDAGVAELADARDLKSRETYISYRFDPGLRHH